MNDIFKKGTILITSYPFYHKKDKEYEVTVEEVFFNQTSKSGTLIKVDKQKNPLDRCWFRIKSSQALKRHLEKMNNKLKKELSQLKEGDKVYPAFDGKPIRAKEGVLVKINNGYLVKAVYDNDVEETKFFDKVGKEMVDEDNVPYYLFTAQYFKDNRKYLSQKCKEFNL